MQWVVKIALRTLLYLIVAGVTPLLVKFEDQSRTRTGMICHSHPTKLPKDVLAQRVV